MVRVVFVLVVVGVTIYALVDCWRSDEPGVRLLPRSAWFLVILLLPLLGGVLWIVAGQPRDGDGSERSLSRPVAPDDDPEFLRRLDLERRRQAAEEERRRKRDGGGPEGEDHSSDTPA